MLSSSGASPRDFRFAVKKVSKSIGGVINIFSVGPKFLEFLETRNRSLLAEEMGLGEYIYIPDYP